LPSLGDIVREGRMQEEEPWKDKEEKMIVMTSFEINNLPLE